jgi:hypothetical protein
MTSALDIAREYFPDYDDCGLDYVIWEHTGYPSFWHGDDIEAEFRSQLEFYKYTIECPACNGWGIDPRRKCYCCDGRGRIIP